MVGSLMTAAEVAELLGVPVSWVYEQSRRGRIPTVTLGRYRRYRRGAIDQWIGELEARTGGLGATKVAREGAGARLPSGAVHPPR
jgi:excisionase family DNA binding protein